MPNYKKYPKYRDSGVKWLGDIPEGWELWKMSHAFNTIGSGTTPSTTKQSYYNGYIPWVTTGELRENIITETKKMLTDEALSDNSSLRKFPIGSILIAMYGATIGRLGVLGVKATTNQACCVMTDSSDISNKYLYYWLMGYKDEIVKLGYGGGQPNISQDTIINLKVSAPSISEQLTIANYLDNATAKIDTLIEKQTKLIELLKEKRQAVISTAVTRGLDSSVPMKDSGVEWFGEIPEHWISTKVKNMLSTPVTDGPHETPEFLDEGVPFVSAEAISKGYINFNKIRGHISLEDNKKYSPKLHDVYMIKSGATTGITAIVEDRVDFNIWSPLAVFRANSRLNPYYLLNYLRSSNFQKAVELYWSYGTQQNIGMNVLENLHISIPPIEEQNDIADYLDDKTSKIDNLITKATKAIDLLKERRTALISAVVTGKIDVRGEVV